jgi:glycine/D-amino acid oxidase-like deaminating enzyme
MMELPSTEIVVLGGTFRGITTAIDQARAGRSVTLIESRTYLGYEITATLRPWLPANERFADVLAACLESSGGKACLGEIPLHLDALKKCLEEMLLDVGVTLLYGCNPVERVPAGLLVGAKGGKYYLACQTVFDARFFPETASNDNRMRWSALTLEFEGVAFAEYEDLSEMPKEIVVPENLGIVDNKLQLHRGYRKSAHPYLRSHVLVECRMILPEVGNDPIAQTKRYIDARKASIAVAEYLLWTHPAFRLASLGKVSEALFEPRMSDGLFHPPSIQEPVTVLSGAEMEEMHWDVIVIGGGTSGALAAFAAGSEGAKTLVVEMNPGLGGTGTYGGVSAYWMGRQKGFSALSRSWTDELHDRLRFPHMEGLLAVWNIEAKTQALLEKCQDQGVSFLLDTRVVDVVADSGRLSAVIAVTPCGVVRLAAKIFIDATGDGDVAAFAGAAFTYGSKRDGIVMWYSLPQFKGPGRIQGNFTAMLDATDLQDYTRAILWGRRRGGTLYDHGSYLAPRETRHIHGEFTQTLADQLLCRAYPDVISLAISNNDMKGHTSSEWMKIGLIPPNLYIEISYRMLLPKGLEGILVVGKAISVERDALPSIRMQPDFENLGGAAGVAAALAVRDGVGLRELNLRAVQERLVDVGTLQAETLTRSLELFQPTELQIQNWIEHTIADPQPLWAISTMGVDEFSRQTVPFAGLCCSGQRGITLIEQALTRPLPAEARSKLGRALALMGSSAAVDVLIQALQPALSGSRLPDIQGDIRHTCTEAPDQAAMPEAAYLLYALALCRDQRALLVWHRVAELLTDETLEDIFSTQRGTFAYVDALCSGAESLGDPAIAPILEKLAAQTTFRGYVLTHPSYPPGRYPDYLYERAAYLELVLARALARCGSPHGVLTLINYLADVRTIYAKHARSELQAISGRDFGVDASEWVQWLESAEDSLKPTPWLAPLEIVSASQQDILLVPKVLGQSPSRSNR